ncbi:phospholipase D zeta 1 [Olea europaea subsp. europaea]|uniref:phospholipase D n=1 Tax=Olea europaea subsp. europaea TaxID=158383 RepID=A0A8S0QU27_OLEEU|nr:phospholipase D zeta 1 [Olea europaea subsp. europaea]
MEYGHRNYLKTNKYYSRSHHEKLVIVDHNICFIGGLDLCFGRYDATNHKVGDFPPFLAWKRLL